jgi:cytochrome c oxidase subunit 2
VHLVCGLAALAATCGAAWPATKSRELDLVLSRTPDPARGAKLYETCAACHGAQAEGIGDGSAPAIAGQPFTVVAKQLVDFRTGARSDPRMQHFADTTHLAYSQEVADVAGYVSQLVPRTPPLPRIDAGAPRGAIIYIRRCERCHGAIAEGNEAEFAPRLAGQHAEYLVRQLTDAAAGVRPAMKEAHAGVIDSLSHDDIAAVAASLSSL